MNVTFIHGYDKIKKIALGLSVSVLLAGCTIGDYGMRTDTRVSSLNRYLGVAYAELAKAEAEESDWSDYRYFTHKSQKAAAGEKVMETALDERDFTPDTLSLAYKARVSVVSMRRQGAFDKFPGPAAKLQAAHDCYLQELEENRQPDDIARCKAELDKQYARLEDLMSREVASAKPAAKPAAKSSAKPSAKVEAMEKSVPGPFNIYFDFDSAALSKSVMGAIDNIAKSAMKAKVSRVKIYGYTDSQGDTNYNAKLALQRARNVRDQLRKSGLRNTKMTILSKGETSQQVKTQDGTKERLNRRVKLLFSR